MIVGTGIDVVDIGRIESVLARQGQRFVRRILTPEEIAVYEQMARGRKIQYLAGRFAIKEAVAKAFGAGIGGRIGWHDVITDQDNGRPTAVLSSAAKRRLAELPALAKIMGCVEMGQREATAVGDALLIHVSLSHERRLLVAQAVVEWNGKSACPGG